MNILEFKHILPTDINLVGGKGASLGKLTQAGISVPPGFVVTTSVYKEFYNQEMTIEIEEEILKAFDELPSFAKATEGKKRVAVRSSAVAEDSTKNSWAGQLESYLNVTREDLLDKVRECWNSIHSERALSYAAGQDLSEDQLAVAVVVQKMVESEVSGVMFTINPVTKNAGEMMIEAGFGLGEYLVQGMITPDNFLVDKSTLKVKSVDIQTQNRMLAYKDGITREIGLTPMMGSQQALSHSQVQELAKIGLEIEKHYGVPQDIEWALQKNKFYILQSRPITA